MSAVFAAGGLALAVACGDDQSPAATASISGTAPAGNDTPRACEGGAEDGSPNAAPDTGPWMAAILEGQKTFRFDTFGDEAFWGDTLQLHRVIEGEAHGGVGPGVSPKAALAVGFKVDATAVPNMIAGGIKSGSVNLDDPATTLALLKLDAVVGVKAVVNDDGSLKTLGLSCAFCHSTVDDSFAPGIGNRLDGWPNRDLDVGAIISLSPDLSALTTALGISDETARAVLKAWGPGKFDAELILDGKGVRPDGKTAATLIPPAYGLAGVNLHTYTGWGSVPYWNGFVAVLEMHGQGSFFDPRLDDATRFPLAARNKLGHVQVAPDKDLVSAKLPGLHVYQLALAAPRAKDGSFDAGAAQRGQALFAGAAKCASCHVPPTYSEPGWNMHTAAEIGIDDFQSSRSPDGRYRTTPLRGLAAHAKGGYYHDGRFATLADVVTHYDAFLRLGLTDAQRSDLTEYLKSL